MKTTFLHLMVFFGILGSISAQVLPPLTVTKSDNPSPGAIYLAPNCRESAPIFAPSLLVAGVDGKPVASSFLKEFPYDFRVLADGRMGYSVFQSPGSGTRASSSIYIIDTTLTVVDTIDCDNGYNVAMHSFGVLANGNRIVIAQENLTLDMSKVVEGGNPAATVQAMYLQELDIDGNVIFQWRSLDHFPVTVSYEDLKAPSIQYFHLNGVTLDTDGHFLISARNASLIAKIHRKTGKVLWILGGKLNQFTFSAEPGITDEPLFSYQHDVVRLPNGNITLFDNGNQRTPQWSRAVEYKLDEQKKTCTLVWQYRKSPDLYAQSQGSVQTLKNGNRLVSWGSALQNNKTTITEVSTDNKEVYEMQLPAIMYPYKALKAPYPPGRYAADVLIDEILPTNTYTYTRGTDTVGLTITYHTLISFFYNTTTARRYGWAPENPRFERIVDGKPVATLAPYVVHPCRVTLTQEGMVDHAGEFRFSAKALGIADPSNTVVYYRDTIGKHSFRPLRTRYNPNTRELVVDTTRAGEFCFGIPVLDSADSIAPPVLLWPIAGKPVLRGSKFILGVSPQGQTQFVSYEIQQPLGKPLVTSVDKDTDKEIAPGLNPGTYYWRAKSRYGVSTSEWSSLDTFVVSDPFLTIDRPQQSSVWYHDSSYVISWNTNVAVPVKIDLVRNNSVVATIKDNAPGEQLGYLWKVPVSIPQGTGYTIRVTPMDVTLDSIIRETPFSIEIRGVPSAVDDTPDYTNISMGPNPATSTLYIGGQTPITEAMMFDAMGSLVVVQRVHGTGVALDVSTLANGAYVLGCQTPSGLVLRAITVQR